MNATKDAPTPAPSADPTRRAFRQWAALWIGFVIVLTAAITIRQAYTGVDGADLAAVVWNGLLHAVSIAATVNLFVMLFSPGLARRTGLPALGKGDEREGHLASHAYSTAYAVGLVGTFAYGWLFNEPGVRVITVLMVAAFFLSLICFAVWRIVALLGFMIVVMGRQR